MVMTCHNTCDTLTWQDSMGTSDLVCEYVDMMEWWTLLAVTKVKAVASANCISVSGVNSVHPRLIFKQHTPNFVWKLPRNRKNITPHHNMNKP